MKKFQLILVTLALLISASGKAVVPPILAYNQDTSSVNLLATFLPGPQLQATTTGLTFAEVDVINGISTAIEVNCNSATKPSAGAAGSFQVAGSSSYSTRVMANVQVPLVGGKCWVRSVSGTISSGSYQLIGYQY